MKILFLGSSRFSLIVLKELLSKGENVVGVITQPDKPCGRGHKLTASPVKVFASEKNIKVYDFDKVKNHIQEIKNIDYDIALVASFGQILPQEFLDIHLTINVHPSLLPKYRGATPIQSAILNGDEMTGVTIMKVAKEVDSGDILLQEEVEIHDEYYLELEEILAKKGGQMASEVIHLIKNNECVFREQNHNEATFVSKLSKQDGILDFNSSCKHLLCQIRALCEENGAFIIFEGMALKVGGGQVSEENLPPRQISSNKKHFVIGCKDGSIEILKVQSPSGKMISGRDFINGHNDILGKMVDDVK